MVRHPRLASSDSLVRRICYGLSLILTAIYAALFPGATLTVALDRVPEWGIAFGGVLLVLQGTAALCWLGGRNGWRGLFIGLLVGVLGGAVEYVGVTTGFPFGRYAYTAVLQPQVFGTVPLAICAAWMMVVPSSLVLAQHITPHHWGERATLLVAATLVLLLDLQIETVATRVNQYWTWHDTGWYYGVPFANFVAWWLVGLALAWLVRSQGSGNRGQGSERGENWHSPSHPLTPSRYVPHALYLFSTLMFAVTNLAWGYTLAGLIGVAVLTVVASLWKRWLPHIGSATQRVNVPGTSRYDAEW